MDGAIAAAEIDGQRFSQWIETAGISRSTAFELVKLLGLDLEQRKVPGSNRPVAFATAEQVQLLDAIAGRLRDGGVTLAELRRDPRLPGVAAIVPAAAATVPDDPGLSETLPDLPLLDRLQALEIAMATGAPLTTAEVRQLLGVFPGAARVTRGRVTAARIGRNQWILEGPGQSETV